MEYMVSLMPQPLGKQPHVPTKQEASWAPQPVWTFWRRDQISCPCQDLNPGSSSPYSGHYIVHAIPATNDMQMM